MSIEMEEFGGNEADLLHGSEEYGADQIQILEGLEAVRKRPGAPLFAVYIIWFMKLWITP